MQTRDEDFFIKRMDAAIERDRRETRRRLRDEFAMAAIPYLAGNYSQSEFKSVARSAYVIADAMLEARKVLGEV